MEMAVVTGHVPEHVVPGVAERLRQPFRIRRLEIEREARVVGRSLAVEMVVRRYQADLLAGSRGPDIRQVEDLQRFAGRQAHGHPKSPNHCSLAKGGSVYPWEASSERTPSSAFPCCSTALASRLFASRSAAVVRRCSAMRNATTAPASSHGRIVFLNSIQMFIEPPENVSDKRPGGRKPGLKVVAAHTD